jgi:hypothetical protein
MLEHQSRARRVLYRHRSHWFPQPLEALMILAVRAKIDRNGHEDHLSVRIPNLAFHRDWIAEGRLGLWRVISRVILTAMK